ncbi:MAG: Mu transposase C-terminal domain-containing protein [Acetobacteraceae bacterium]
MYGGKIGTVQCDNAREFKGERLRAALKQYDVGLQLRPLKQPQYGAYIERFMGIRAQQTHRIPGTTFASIDERGTYDSERAATMTLREYRAYILDWTVNIYHQKPHSALKMPPSRRYELGIMGDNDHPGTGSITLPGSPEEIRLNFLPFEWRQVGRHGIRFMDMDFFHEVLIPWIDAEDVEDKRRKRRFLVRFDYEDITTKIWFWDPHLEQYFEIPNRRLMRPASQWEVKLALRLMKEDGGRHTDIDRIHAAMQRLDRRIEEAQGKTRHARKLAQRKLDAERVAKNRKPAADQSSGENSLSGGLACAGPETRSGRPG